MEWQAGKLSQGIEGINAIIPEVKWIKGLDVCL